VTVLIETPPTGTMTTGEAGDPPAELTYELAWCLQRFVTGRADEPAMRRAEQVLATWDAWRENVTIDLTST
jgi:hypothetical protein